MEIKYSGTKSTEQLEALFNAFIPPITSIKLSNNFTFDLLRLDLIDNYISGNKWYKLKYNLKEALLVGCNTVITFGGAYSNHLVAAAEACQRLSLQCVCIIRGEEPLTLNPRLKFIKSTGAVLHFVSRADYRLKEQSPTVKNIIAIYNNAYIIPEGGANEAIVKGCTEILKGNAISYDIICCAAGTGTMAAGLARSLQPHQQLWVFPAIHISGESYTESELYLDIIRQVPKERCVIEFIKDYDFGGYAKTSTLLKNFIQSFQNDYQTLLDTVYNGKMLFGLFDMIYQNKMDINKRILVIHCGGIFPGE